MNYKEQLYKSALEAVADIYRRSMYDPSVDLYRSFDIINSVNENQIASKEWLVKELLPFINTNGKGICVLGGWYGLTALMLRQHIPNNIDSVDIDPLCKPIGKILTREYENIYFHHDSAADWFFDRPKNYQLIINTSIEHMEQDDIDLMLGLKPDYTAVCFQGNNYHEIQSHINTHNSLDEFVDSFNLSTVFVKKALPSPDGKYERYMVIGK